MTRGLGESRAALRSELRIAKTTYGEASYQAAILRSFLRRKTEKERFLIYICNKDVDNARAVRAKLRELRLEMLESICEADAEGKAVRVDFEGRAPFTTAGEAVRQLADEIKAHDEDEALLLDALEGVLNVS